MKVITRFAPSPTGYLHIGNARAILTNWLYAKKHQGEFILRFDDTDLERSKAEYADAIQKDLKWLGLEWHKTFNQSSRVEHYSKIKEFLLQKKRLYPCFESSEELEMKRKIQLSSGRPPLYDRASLHLNQEQIQNNLEKGKLPHYRFYLEDEPIYWKDMIKGEVNYEGKNLSDPVVIREDGSLTYMLCSVIDDIDYNITHILRGEDHVTNTAVQIQMFKALNGKVPEFGHFSLVISKDEKISKRVGGFEIGSLRDEIGYEAMAINSFFSQIGTSKPLIPYKNLEELAADFDVCAFSKSPTTYLPEELERLNHKLLINLEYNEIKDKLLRFGYDYIDENFWLMVRPNLKKFKEIKDWWKICYSPEKIEGLDKDFLNKSAEVFPIGEINLDTWNIWITKLSEVTGKKGKELFLPLRLALTGMDYGPELKHLLPLLQKEEILKRLKG